MHFPQSTLFLSSLLLLISASPTAASPPSKSKSPLTKLVTLSKITHTGTYCPPESSTVDVTYHPTTGLSFAISNPPEFQHLTNNVYETRITRDCTITFTVRHPPTHRFALGGTLSASAGVELQDNYMGASFTGEATLGGKSVNATTSLEGPLSGDVRETVKLGSVEGDRCQRGHAVSRFVEEEVKVRFEVGLTGKASGKYGIISSKPGNGGEKGWLGELTWRECVPKIKA
ncbi:hypothetical protein BJ508DRAFT_410531 [Ascobolus immersus RN42]|uniref:Ubiquitin 3 binding protein But2 C-terminal domain-containing protein n=1 Tax=Ascobolus immersus RN42 TaxID=1160509 RepID=A0A3N4INV8_ASCIM|nr:hypothetical protein BJ508DRAFT_410531 [Ascobolus immersus RN42]